jgi:hypothetical protein
LNDRRERFTAFPAAALIAKAQDHKRGTTR